MIDKIRPRKLNASADSRLRKNDEMQDALNLVSSNDFRSDGDTTEGNDATGNAGVLKPTRGNKAIARSGDSIVISGETHRVIGSVTDHENNVVYFFLYHRLASTQGVYAYDPTGYLPGGTASEEYTKVYTSAQFNFPSTGFIKADIVKVSVPFSHPANYANVTEFQDNNSAGILNDDGKEYDSQPVLYFTDNQNEPRKLHPLRALSDPNILGYDSPDIKDFITACPKTPIHPITAIFRNDINDPTSSFEGLPGFQFAYQHLYKSGEESALSTFSDIAVPPAYYSQGASATSYLSSNNKCELTIPSTISYTDTETTVIRTKEIGEVRILARVGNSGSWKVIKEVPVEDLVANNNKYDFYNRRIFGGFSQTDAIKPFDNLPQVAQAQAIVSDRLTYGNYVEGYDNVRVEAKATVKYHERPNDFTNLDIKVTPVIKRVHDASDGGQQNKRAGYDIDTTAIPDNLSAGSTINFELFVRPNRNFHIYNSHRSFHGSRHMSLDDGALDETSGSTIVSAPEVWGEGATLNETCGDISQVQDLKTMWGRNTGIGTLDSEGKPILRWQTTNSQTDLSVDNPRCVYGTSAANPFILRGNNLRFSVRLRVLGELGVDTLSTAQSTIKAALTASLSNSEYDYEENGLELLDSSATPTYFINEGLSGGTATTTIEEAVSGRHRIPVASGGDTGGDDRKHLICAVGNFDVINEGAELEEDTAHQSPCGYFIVNKAKVEFGLIQANNSLVLDLKSVSDLEILTAVPFIDAEAWKDDAYEADDDDCGIIDDGNDQRNYGVRDATYWSLDSLIIDSWYVYSSEYVVQGVFNPKIYTPIAKDFPRYMNGGIGIDPGDPNPDQANGGSEPGIGKNAAIVDIDAYGVGDTGGFLDSRMFRIRSRGGQLGWGEGGCGNEFEQWYIKSYLKIASQLHDIHTKDKLGRSRLIGYLAQGNLETDFYDANKDGGGNGVSIIDGAIGPGSSFNGGENIRSGLGAAESAYAIGSVSGEMVFTGRIAPRGYFIPTKVKQGGRAQPGGGLFGNNYTELWRAYGQGPMLPYLGGLYYQLGQGTQEERRRGHIHNYTKSDDASSSGILSDDFDAIHDTANWKPFAKYLGYNEQGSNSYNEFDVARNDLFNSAKLNDAEINFVELESRVVDASDAVAGGRSFKTRATHAFGLVYYDERGRSGNVNPISFTEINDEEISGGTEGVYVKGYSNEERNDKGRVSVEITIENDPPEWAHNYQVVYGGNTTKSNFIHYTTGGACVSNLNLNEEGTDEGEDPSSTNIYVSLNYLQNNKDVSYAEAFGAVSPLGRKELYTHREGDKLRVLSYHTGPDTRVWPHDVEFDILGVETVTNNPEENIFRKAFEKEEDNNVVADFRTGQFLVLRNTPSAEGFNYSSVKEGKNEAETTAHNWNDICVVEIYSPSKNVDDDQRLFYETGKVYDIGLNDQNQLFHKTNFIRMSKGDVWFRRGALAVPEYGDLEQDFDGNDLDSFGKFKNLIQRGNEDGDSSPRFKDYFVESMTFNDTFAGNNVIGIGKPKAIRPDEQQVRKRSSIIHSDKHNFSKRNIRFTSFNGTASNFKDLPGEYGRINYLQNNYDSLICIQENKTSSVPVERNIISDASGSKNLITSNKVIGVQAFFAGEYGCDNNPESVVKTDSATYFASKSKSEVYRLTSQGIQVISDMGLKSYFFRLFEEAKKDLPPGGKVYLPGGYDPLKDEFLITVGQLNAIETAGAEIYVQPGMVESIEEPLSGFEDAGDDELSGIDVDEDAEAPLFISVSPSQGFFINPNNTSSDFLLDSQTQVNLNLYNISSTGTIENLSWSAENISGWDVASSITLFGTPTQNILIPYNPEIPPNSTAQSDFIPSPDLSVLKINTPETIDEEFFENGFYSGSALVTIHSTNAPDVSFPIAVIVPEVSSSGARFNFQTSATWNNQPIEGGVEGPVTSGLLSSIPIGGLVADTGVGAAYQILVTNVGDQPGKFSMPSINSAVGAGGIQENFFKLILSDGFDQTTELYDEVFLYGKHTFGSSNQFIPPNPVFSAIALLSQSLEDTGDLNTDGLYTFADAEDKRTIDIGAGETIELLFRMNTKSITETSDQSTSWTYPFHLDFSESELLAPGQEAYIDSTFELNSIPPSDFLPGDFNLDGIVGSADLLLLATAIALTPAGIVAAGEGYDQSIYDFDNSGVVGSADYILFLSQFGESIEAEESEDSDEN